MVRVPKKGRGCSQDAAGAPGTEANRRSRGATHQNSNLVVQQEQLKETGASVQLHHNEYNNS